MLRFLAKTPVDIFRRKMTKRVSLELNSRLELEMIQATMVQNGWIVKGHSTFIVSLACLEVAARI
ncbi:MAG TPA: hypothetical protein PKA76_11770, partial [Pirellulaceae bacterium]|nr:hypothetical protein [Pirellulaceae bacterium]HMP70024.1 hypothetical protein [Pirellulaceae bacterium]